MGERLWQLDGVTIHGSDRARLNDVTLTLRDGITAIIGDSGAGKTSLLNLLVGFERPSTGRVDSRLPENNGQLGMFWSPDKHGLWPHMTALQHITAVETDVANAKRLLDEFDLSDKATALPDTLSQGERSRLSVARAIAAEPIVLVMDEPLVNVDPARVDKYWDAIRRHMESSGIRSLVFSTHDPAKVLAHAEQVICLKDGCVLYDGNVDPLYRQPQTKELAECLGETNWFDPQALTIWFGDANQSQCVRPEQIAIVKDETSNITVKRATFAGSVARAELVHPNLEEPRTILHRPSGNQLREGDHVIIKMLMTLLFSLSLLGCVESSGPELTVKETHYWIVSPEGARFPSPRSVEIGPNFETITVDNGGRVMIYDTKGKLIRKWFMPSNEDGNAEGTCWLKDGRIAVADTHYHRIVFYDQQGKLLSTLGELGREGKPGTFIYPVSVVQDDKENLYVAEFGGQDRIQKFTVDGKFIKAFGDIGTGPGQFQRASGMVWHDGKIYIADAENGRIHVFSDEGEFIRMMGSSSESSPGEGELELRFPYDVDVGPDGALYVVEWGAGRISKVSMDGKLMGTFGSPGTGENQFRTPWGIAVDSNNRIVVADTENRRIVELKL